MEEREEEQRERERKFNCNFRFNVADTDICVWVRMPCSALYMAWLEREKRENKHLMRAVFTFYSSCYDSYDWNG